MDTLGKMTGSGDRVMVQELIDQGVLTINDGYRAKKSEMAQEGLPFVRAGDVDERIDTSDCDLLSRVAVESAKESEKVSRPGDAIFTSKGTVGRFAFVKESAPQFVYSPQLSYWRVHDTDTLAPRFLHFWMKSRDFWAQLAAVKGQTDMADYVSLRDQKKMEVPLPTIVEQCRVADILGTLDDKIELNREMNRTLESMARVIFKSWFVDFDPVRAKQEGREPKGIDPETAAMFPVRLVDSELGEIPEGWEVAPMKEVVKVTPRYKLNEGDNAPYLEMSNCPTEGHYPVDWRMREYHGSGSKFSNGDTLMAKITPCLENGKTAFVDFLTDDDTIGWGSTEYLVLRSKSPLPLEYSYYLARSEPLRQRCIKAMTGTSGRQRVRVSAFKSFKTVVPPKNIAQRFGDIVRGLMAKVRQNNQESHTLASMRDTLLPKLLSGDLQLA